MAVSQLIATTVCITLLPMKPISDMVAEFLVSKANENHVLMYLNPLDWNVSIFRKRNVVRRSSRFQIASRIYPQNDLTHVLHRPVESAVPK